MEYPVYIKELSKVEDLKELLYLYMENVEYHSSIIDTLLDRFDTLFSYNIKNSNTRSDLVKVFIAANEFLYMVYYNCKNDVPKKKKVVTYFRKLTSNALDLNINEDLFTDSYTKTEIAGITLTILICASPSDINTIDILTSNYQFLDFVLKPTMLTVKLAEEDLDTQNDILLYIKNSLIGYISGYLNQKITKNDIMRTIASKEAINKTNGNIYSESYSIYDKHCDCINEIITNALTFIDDLRFNGTFEDIILKKFDKYTQYMMIDICNDINYDAIDKITKSYSKAGEIEDYHVYSIIELLNTFANNLKNAPKLYNLHYYRFVKNSVNFFIDEIRNSSINSEYKLTSLGKNLMHSVLSITPIENKVVIESAIDNLFDNDFIIYYNRLTIANESEDGRDSLSMKAHKAKKKIYAAYKKYKDAEEMVDNQLDKMSTDLKNKFIGDTRTEIIEGKKFTIIGIMKKLFTTSAIFSYSKIGGILYVVVRFALRRDATETERQKILSELDMEIKILEEKIQDASGDGDRKAKYALMRTKGELEKAKNKIEYGTSIDDRAAKAAAKFLKGVRK